MLRAALLVEVRLVDSVGIPLERQRPVAQVRQQHLGDPDVVVDHLRLGKLHLRVEHLIQVDEPELPRADAHLAHVARAHPCFRFPFAFVPPLRAVRAAARGSAVRRRSPLSGASPLRAAARLLASASIRLTTLPRGSSSVGSATISWPSALRSRRASTCSRKVSLYFFGSNSAASDSTSCSAMWSSFSRGFASAPGTPSSSSTLTISSA